MQILAGIVLSACIVALSAAQSLPGIFGPATGVCGSEFLPYGGSGSAATLQTFVAPASACTPATSDGYTYALSQNGTPAYLLPDPALRVIGTNISPSFGYSDTPAFDLTSAEPLTSSVPYPVPAGVYDLTLNYTSNGNSQCQSTSNTLPSAFVVQAQTASTIIGPSTTVSGASCFSLNVIVTYPASAVQLPFSDPAAAALGSVALAVSGPQTFAVNSSATTVSQGSGFASFQISPPQPLAAGQYSVAATYTPPKQYLVGSTSAPFNFTVTVPVTSPPPTSSAAPPTTTAAPTTTVARTTSAAPSTTTGAPPTSTLAPKSTAAPTTCPACTCPATTSAPSTTTKAPVTSSRPPGTTSKAPVTSTPTPTSTKAKAGR